MDISLKVSALKSRCLWDVSRDHSCTSYSPFLTWQLGMELAMEPWSEVGGRNEFPGILTASLLPPRCVFIEPWLCFALASFSLNVSLSGVI